MSPLGNKDSKTFELDFLNFINSYVKQQGGKGPRQTEVKFMGDTVVYFIRGILTEREKKLIQTKEGERVVIEARRLFLEIDKEQRIATFEHFFNCKIIDNYESWNLEKDSAAGIFVLEKNMFD